MSRDDKDLPLGDISQINVDEKPTPKAPPKQAAPKTASPTAKAAPKTAAPVAASSSGSNKGLWFLVLVLLLLVAGLAAAGWGFYQQFTEVKSQLDHELSQSDERLGSLATELTSTGESTSSHISALQKATDTLATSHKALEGEQKKQMDEIRKLWDVSNKRNKVQIDANEKEIKALKQGLAEYKKTADSLTTDLKKAQQQAADAVKRAEASEKKVAAGVSRQTQLETQLDLASETQKQLQAQLKEQEQVIKPLADALPALKELAKLQQGDKALGARIKELEEAVNAFDMYRRQVNQRLDALE